jgi:putative hemolysin
VSATLIGAHKTDEPPVTEEELAAMLDAGTAAGVFAEEEHDLVERVFWLGDQRVASLMTPRHRIEWLDVRDSAEVHREELIRHRFSHYLVCDGGVDQVLGIVQVKDLLAKLLEGQPLDLVAALRTRSSYRKAFVHSGCSRCFARAPSIWRS